MTVFLPTSSANARMARARAFAMEMIDRLVRCAAPGFHVIAGAVRRSRETPPAHAGLVIVRPGDPDRWRPRAQISVGPARDAFAALLTHGRLTGDPVALLMRSCDDESHHSPGHQCVVRGWISRDGLARPMRASSVRATANAARDTTDPPRGPHPCLPPHPPGVVQYETAYPLRPHDPDVP
jgi:hypothetical protein